MNADPINMIHTSKNQQKKSWTNNLKNILDQEKISIEANKSEHSTDKLSMTSHKPAGGVNPYTQFGYGP